ncbi:MAG: hypothetical protein U0935_04925 [Pirellulales bacterium]
MPRIIQQRPKPKREIKVSCGIIKGIDFHGPNTHLLGNRQRPSQGVHQKQRSVGQSLTLPPNSTQSPDGLKGNGDLLGRVERRGDAQLRAQVITGRWDERVAAMRRLELRATAANTCIARRHRCRKAEASSQTDE